MGSLVCFIFVASQYIYHLNLLPLKSLSTVPFRSFRWFQIRAWRRGEQPVTTLEIRVCISHILVWVTINIKFLINKGRLQLFYRKTLFFLPDFITEHWRIPQPYLSLCVSFQSVKIISSKACRVFVCVWFF